MEQGKVSNSNMQAHKKLFLTTSQNITIDFIKIVGSSITNNLLKQSLPKAQMSSLINSPVSGLIVFTDLEMKDLGYAINAHYLICYYHT